MGMEIANDYWYQALAHTFFYLKPKGRSFMLVEFETLKRMFEDSPDKSHLSFSSCCKTCGCQVTIEIHNLPSGFGLEGGVMFEANSGQLLVKCDACHQKKLKLVCTVKEEFKRQQSVAAT